MKSHFKSGVLLATLSASLAIEAAAQNNFILEADPANVSSVAATYGLTVLDQVPSHGVALVTGVTSNDQIAVIYNDPNVYNFEAVGQGAAPEALANIQLNQSTTAILDNLPGRVLTTYFGVTTVSNYVNQTAVQIINLARAQSTYNATGSGVVAIIDTGIDPNHPVLQGSIVPGYDFTRNQAGIPNEMDDLDPNTAGLLQGTTPELGKTAAVPAATAAHPGGNNVFDIVHNALVPPTGDPRPTSPLPPQSNLHPAAYQQPAAPQTVVPR